MNVFLILKLEYKSKVLPIIDLQVMKGRIFLKYNERITRHKNKLNAGFYIVIAACLLIIGGAAWFALSSYNDMQSGSSMISKPSESYSNDINSYTENTSSVNQTPQQNTESVAEKVESEPYNPPQSEVTETTPKFNFTMPTGEIIKGHSENELQYSATYGDMRLHTGFDIACKNGENVTAFADGTILNITESGTLGTIVEIDHSFGITVKYSNIKNPKFKVGDTVKMGDIIGTATTVPGECNDQSHIHIEILKDGKYANFSALGFN